MARYDFGGTLADFVVTSRRIGGLDVLGLSAATLTFWSAQTNGTRYTDLQLNGSAVSSITVAADGQVPTFQGPDAVTTMWADGGSGRVRIVAQGIPGPAGPPGSGGGGTGALSVIDYGAKGDSTTDNLAAFVAALAAAGSAGGGRVVVPRGTYKIILTAAVGNLLLPANTTLSGEGGATLLFDTDTVNAYHGLIANTGDNTAIENVTIKRNSDFPAVAFPLNARDGFRLTGVTLDGQRDTFTTNYFHGIQTGATGTLSNVRIERSTFKRCSYGLFQANASTGTTAGLVVRDSVFTNNYASDLEFNAPSSTMTDVTVDNCTFRSNQTTASGAGFGVGLAHVTRATVQGNSFSGYQNEPVHVEDYSSQVLISGNKFDNCAMTRASYIQVISGCTRVHITDNDIDATANTNFPTCISILAGGTGNTPGGRATIAPTDCTVAGSQITAGGANGIYIEATTRCKVLNNKLLGLSSVNGLVFGGANGGWGIHLYDGIANDASGNTIRGFNAAFRHRNDTIRAGGQAFVLAANNISDCNYGISMVNTGSGVISGNQIYNTIHPMITGTGGTSALPVVIAGNHAYACKYPLEIAGKVVVIASGAAAVGSAVTLAIGALALQMPSGTVVTFSGGGVLTLTAAASVGATSLTGNLTTAAVASGQDATVTGLAHSTVGAQNKITVSGNGDSVAGTY